MQLIHHILTLYNINRMHIFLRIKAKINMPSIIFRIKHQKCNKLHNRNIPPFGTQSNRYLNLNHNRINRPIMPHQWAIQTIIQLQTWMKFHRMMIINSKAMVLHITILSNNSKLQPNRHRHSKNIIIFTSQSIIESIQKRRSNNRLQIRMTTI